MLTDKQVQDWIFKCRESIRKLNYHYKKEYERQKQINKSIIWFVVGTLIFALWIFIAMHL